MEMFGLHHETRLTELANGKVSADLVLTKRLPNAEEVRIVSVPGEFEDEGAASAAAFEYFKTKVHAW